jgi:hypothetical protein
LAPSADELDKKPPTSGKDPTQRLRLRGRAVNGFLSADIGALRAGLAAVTD